MIEIHKQSRLLEINALREDAGLRPRTGWKPRPGADPDTAQERNSAPTRAKLAKCGLQARAIALARIVAPVSGEGPPNENLGLSSFFFFQR